MPAAGVCIGKDSSVNEDIDRLRMEATLQFLLRNDVSFMRGTFRVRIDALGAGGTP